MLRLVGDSWPDESQSSDKSRDKGEDLRCREGTIFVCIQQLEIWILSCHAVFAQEQQALTTAGSAVISQHNS